MPKTGVPTDTDIAKAKDEEQKAKASAHAAQRRLAKIQRKVEAAQDAQRQARLLTLGRAVKAAGFTVEDLDFLVQALAWLRVMRDDPDRWELLQSGLVDEVVGGHTR